MSILIKGISAGELLRVFEWARIGANNCMIGHDVIATELPNHGDLIDRDEAAHEVWLIRCEECGAAEWACESCDNGTAMKRVMDAPVVIPAERSE